MEKQKSKIWKFALPIFIILVMVMSGVGYMMGENSSESVKYNNLKFVKSENGVWTAYKEDKQIVLFNNPNELTNIKVEKIDFNQLNSAEKIYISLNSEDNLGNYLQGLQFNLLNNLAPKKISACYKDSEPCKDLPLKDCKDATNSVKIIVIKKGDNTTINYNNNCLNIQGKDEELVKFIDKMVLEMFA